MKAFSECHGILVPLFQANLDTDRIIPKQYLKTVERAGLGAYLFDGMRYADVGFPGKPAAEREQQKDFILNQSPYDRGRILIAGENFGCGSSREHAVWSLLDFGIQVVIAPSFADIFFTNCSKNGLLPVMLPLAECKRLAAAAERNPGLQARVVLAGQVIILDEADEGRDAKELNSKREEIRFEIDPNIKKVFIEGLDDIAMTLSFATKIKSFETRHHIKYPWLTGSFNGGMDKK